jgi:hypothetical protein
MRHVDSPSLLARLLRRRPRRHEVDAGDMGTAFGMEITLSGCSHLDEEPVVVPPPSRPWYRRMFGPAAAGPQA